MKKLFKHVLGIFLCVFIITNLLLQYIFASDSTSPEGDVLMLQVTNDSSTNVHCYYMKFSNKQYTFQAGDFIEYDVKILNNEVGVGGIECDATDGTSFRDISGWVDQNGISGHPGADLSSKAHNIWYHRKLAVPSSMVAKVSGYWDVVGATQTLGVTTTALYDNIVVTDSSGIQKAVIFQSKTNIIINGPDIVYNATAIMGLADIDGNLKAYPSEEVLSLQVTNDSSTNVHCYYMKFSDLKYTFQVGDYIEYDVKILDNTAGVGGIECIATDGSSFRDIPGWLDQNGLSGHPGAGLGGWAYNTWYHRKLAVPNGMIGKVSSYWDVVGATQTPGIATRALYDNIVVTNGSGTYRTIIFQLSKDNTINGPDIAFNTNASMGIADINGNLLAYPTGEVLSLTVTNDSSSNLHYCYMKFSNTQYTFQAGDYIEYDVRILNNSSYIGGIDCITKDGLCFRSSSEWMDQNRLLGTGDDLSGKAYNTWYHRKLAVPNNFIGKTSSYWDVAGISQVQGKYAALYDNVMVTNGSGTQKEVIFRSLEDNTINSPDVFNCATANLTIVELKNTNLVVKGQNIRNLVGRTVTITYNTNEVYKITDLCALTPQKEVSTGPISGTSIIITQNDPGIIQFTIDKSITSNKSWSGIVNIITYIPSAGGKVDFTCSIE